MAIAGSPAPRASAPVSPMNTFAGLALNHKNAMHAPAIAIDSASSVADWNPRCGGISRTVSTNAVPAIAVSPETRPSRPSVILTKFAIPTMNTTAKIQ